jgi:hypothetical protein
MSQPLKAIIWDSNLVFNRYGVYINISLTCKIYRIGGMVSFRMYKSWMQTDLSVSQMYQSLSCNELFF